MKVVICADNRPTAPYYLFDELLASLKRFGHDPMMLGWELPWTGLGSKPRLLKRAIESGQIADDRMIFCDAFDVVFGCSPETIDEHAREFYGPEIVWNAERSCFPDSSLADRHPPSRTSFRYLNSGFGIGRTEDFLRLLEWMKADEIPDDSRDASGRGVHPNDQDFVMRALVDGQLGMRLDHHAILCQTLCGVTAEDLDFDGPLIANRETGSFPCAFHFNGSAKTGGLAEPILRKMGLR